MSSIMPIPLPSEYGESSLPVALDGQLHWVKRPIFAFFGTSRSYVISGDDCPPSLWWPSILFYDYDEFEDFFSDELKRSADNNDGDSDIKKLILSRMFNNMRHKRTITIAVLLGRPLDEYVEIVEIPSPLHENAVEVQAHEAALVMSFVMLPQEVYIPQIKPKAFTVTSNNNVYIDEDLYMSYMLALDMAATKRNGGPKAPHDTLRSEFRDIGRREIQKVASGELNRITDVDVSTNNDVCFNFNRTKDGVHQIQVEQLPKRLSTKTPITNIEADVPAASDGSRRSYMDIVSNREYAQNRRGAVISDKSMCPGGFLGVTRLDRSFDHIPIEARCNTADKPKLKCAMHRWLGDRKEGKLSYCRTCNVNLCIDCYDLFHMIDGTDEIREEFSRRKEIEATRRLKRKQKGKNSASTDDKRYPYPRKESTCSDKSLGKHAAQMSLSNRTNFSKYRHIPVAPRRHASCAMHRWLGLRKEGNLCFCPDCNVTLCRTCYDDFHKIKDIVEIKYWLKREYTEREGQS